MGRFGYHSILQPMHEPLQLTNTQIGELQSWNLPGCPLAAVSAGMLAARRSARGGVECAARLLPVNGIHRVVPTFDGARAGRFLSGAGGAAKYRDVFCLSDE